MKKNDEKQIKHIPDNNQVVTAENNTETIVESITPIEPVKKKRGNPNIAKHGFKPGAEWKGNAGGRPKGKRSFDSIVEDAFLNLEDKYRRQGIDIPDFELEIFEKLLNDVRAGKEKARDTYFKYRYSQPKQTLELMGTVDVSLSAEEQNEIDNMIKKFNNL